MEGHEFEFHVGTYKDLTKKIEMALNDEVIKSNWHKSSKIDKILSHEPKNQTIKHTQ